MNNWYLHFGVLSGGEDLRDLSIIFTNEHGIVLHETPLVSKLSQLGGWPLGWSRYDSNANCSRPAKTTPAAIFQLTLLC